VKADCPEQKASAASIKHLRQAKSNSISQKMPADLEEARL